MTGLLGRVLGSRGSDVYTHVDGLPGIGLEEYYYIVSADRRRAIVRALCEDYDGETTISELAEYVAALEYNTIPAEVSSQERKRVYVSLYQTHCPTLRDHGIVNLVGTDPVAVTATPLTVQVHKIIQNDETAVSGGEA